MTVRAPRLEWAQKKLKDKGLKEMELKAANENLPLWKEAARQVMAGTPSEKLDEPYFSALYAHAVAICKPTTEEMASHTTRQAKAALSALFVKGYQSGLPPLAQLSEKHISNN